jgi:hypothetical protein
VAEIKDYTLNFVSGRRAARGLTCAARKLAFDEVQRGRCRAAEGADG